MPEVRPGRLVLMAGMPGAGKTTVARAMVAERGAVHLDPDTWLVALGLDPAGPRDRFEELMFEHGLELLGHGLTVVYESGAWVRRRREAKRAAAQAVGAQVELHVFDLPLEERWRRVSARNEVPGLVHISRADLEEWDTWWEPVDDEERAAYDEVVVHGLPAGS